MDDTKKEDPHEGLWWHEEHVTLPLSHLKFVGIRPVALDGLPEERADKTAPAAYVTQDPAQSRSETGVSRHEQGFPHQHGHDRLTSDKPGEELAPDSSIWRMYSEVAKEHDRALVERHNKDLDTMLLFAGLFSAILTAFLVESTNLLEPDLAETSVMLLLDLVRSQQRMETGNQDISLAPIELPYFKPSASVRWINALWFMALALSLGAAMMAMLAKEWLEEFVAGRPTHPHHYARERQSRLDALTSWSTLRIIDFLPTLLHFSLVLFALGLILHLWRLDRIVALILSIASVALFMCYMVVVGFGVIMEQCPYRTRVSKYFKRLLDEHNSKHNTEAPTTEAPNPKCKKPLGEKTSEFEGITTLDLRALEWLTTAERDPGVGDSAFQALAGLKTRGLKQLHNTEPQETGEPGPQDSTECHDNQPWKQLWTQLPWSAASSDCNGNHNQRKSSVETSAILDGYCAVVRMGLEIVKRLRIARKTSPRELAFCRGINVARYAGALPEIYHHANESLKQFQLGLKAEHKKHQNWTRHLESVNCFKQSALQALDEIWNDECPPFTTDAYAELTAAELKLTVVVAGAEVDKYPAGLSEDTEDGAPPSHRSVSMRASSSPHLEVHSRRHWPTVKGALRLLNLKSGPETPSSIFIPDSTPVKLSDLQARCSRALCRAAFQLAFHSNGRAPIGNFSLINMLDSISLLGESPLLSSGSHIITHYPQYNDSSPTTIYVLISGEIGYRILAPRNIGDEDALLAGLTNILGSSSLKAVPKVETAAMKAMGSIAPKLIEQWITKQLGLPYPGPTAPTNMSISELDSNWEGFYESWELLDHNTASSLLPHNRARIVIKYLINIATFAMAFFNHDGIHELPDIAIKALYTGVRARSSPETLDMAYDMISERLMLLGQWLKSIGRARNQGSRRRTWKRESKTYLLRLLAIQNQLETPQTILPRLLWNIELHAGKDTQEIFLTILEAMTEVPGHRNDMEELLRAVLSYVDTQGADGNYAKCFTHIPNGLDCLIKIGSHPNHSQCALETIANLIISLVQRGGRWIESATIHGFLKAILFVIEHPPSQWDPLSEKLLPVLAQTLENLFQDRLFGSEGMVFASFSRMVLRALIDESERINDYKSQESFRRSREMVERKIKKALEVVHHWTRISKYRNEILEESLDDKILDAKGEGNDEGQGVNREDSGKGGDNEVCEKGSAEESEVGSGSLVACCDEEDECGTSSATGNPEAYALM